MMSIYSLTYEELEEYLLSINEKKYRAKQIYDFLYNKRVKSFTEMTNIGSKLVDRLKSDYLIDRIKIIRKQEDKLVKKYLFKLIDGQMIETVVMYHDYGISICISSQVGCNMGCKFCESGRLKKVRNLDAWEMVLQILMVEEDLKERIANVVIMGIGEPFDNYDNVMNFVKIITDQRGIALGSRHITISTCGVIPGIVRFMKENRQVNLAISLHAPNDKIRNSIMPISRVYKLNELMDVLREYTKVSRRRITFEYIMLEGINDSLDNARELANLIKGINSYVNLIPYNETENIGYKRTNNVQILKFYDILKKSGINTTIRREFGSNVDAACGQLRAKESK